MRLSKLLGAEIKNGERKGCIISLNENYDGELSFTCADENEEEFSVSIKNIKIVKDEMTCFREESVNAFSAPVRLGKAVFDCEGNFVGKLTDVIIEKNKISAIIAGNRKFDVSAVIFGDVVLIKNSIVFLKSDVKKNGKIIIRKGTPLTGEVTEKAQKNGEYVQTKLKTL